tara:strand:- start:127 stop:438 length:312 start_codon:yes stop_codon:yes gene_type:complete
VRPIIYLCANDEPNDDHEKQRLLKLFTSWGALVLDPELVTNHLEGVDKLDACQNLAFRCDAVFLANGWRDSLKAQMLVAACQRRLLPMLPTEEVASKFLENWA